MTAEIEKIKHALDQVLCQRQYNVHEPVFDQSDKDYLNKCIDSTFVSSIGAFVPEFEEKISAFTGAKNAIAVVNGTAALHLSLKLSGVEADEEVLLPSATFVATANAVSYLGAHPHFVDISKSDLGIDPKNLDQYLHETTIIKSGLCFNKYTKRLIRAIIPVHLFGLPAQITELLRISRKYKLKVIEDSSEALGSFYKSKHVGTFGDFGVLSFNGNKIITTGGGGMILTNNEKLAEAARHLSTTAKVANTMASEHDQVGFNYRLPNLNAALGLAQFNKLERILVHNQKLHELYRNAFSNLGNISLFSEANGCKSNYWLQTINIDINCKQKLYEIIRYLNSNGYGCRPLWKPIHKLKPYENCVRDKLINTELLEFKLLSLPSGPSIKLAK